jgi:glycosyltransferase involved in cell wall biosynthesis
VLVDHIGKATTKRLTAWRDLWDRNRQVFLDKWMADPAVPRLERCSPERFERNLATARAVATWMDRFFSMRAQFRAQGGTSTRAASDQSSSAAMAVDRWRDAIHDLRAQPDQPPPSAVHSSGLGRLRVTYLVPELIIAGGILGVVQLVNELSLLGAETRIVAFSDTRAFYRWHLVREPILYDDLEEALEAEPHSDVVVATHFSTALLADELVSSGQADVAVYFLQDYEPWFYQEWQEAERDAVRATFDLLPNKIVKSEWLRGLLDADGHGCEKIHIGMDLGFFYPRRVSAERPLVVAMARPKTPRRGFPTVVETLALVHEEMPEVEFALFGQDLTGLSQLPFEYRPLGVISSQEQIAELFSEATIHFDGSDFQAFGRPALEAMACGATSVLTEVGGVGEYAVDGENCFLVPPRAPDVAAERILRLLRDDDLRARFRRAGFETVRRFSVKREARETLTYFQRLHDAAKEAERRAG